ncbi:hypothetical protein [Cupriavidus necator]|uniref:hypothetical protein n=1 Tax=Cupriavidus necator TaxID=106590 RepID=UPI00059CD8CB|nr:hypothetical protein [Cupriavidus necator]MDX6008018.1 hypothetical protein [Cupriavidus necator]
MAELRGRFSETRALYREVCGLLFFRYGVTPTANKLYSLVRKGSKRQAHAATQARLEAGRAEKAAGRQLTELRTQFSTGLERAREHVTIAQERAEASERRALRGLDAERTARQKSERAAEELRGELAAARQEARDSAVAQAEVRARLEAQAAALAERLNERLAAAEAAQRQAAGERDAAQTELAAAQRRAERAEAEAVLARQLLAELRLPREQERRHKFGGPASTDSEAPDEKPADEHGAPTGSNPEDGSDSSDRNDNENDDSKN